MPVSHTHNKTPVFCIATCGAGDDYMLRLQKMWCLSTISRDNPSALISVNRNQKESEKPQDGENSSEQ